MEKIPIRRIDKNPKKPSHSEGFSIRNIRDILGGKDMVQNHHRHDFFHILALEKGSGSHEIDFTAYDISDHSVFFLRPGQVHQLTLKAESMGYLIQFRSEFYFPPDKVSLQLLRKASNRNHYQLDVNRFGKIFSILTSIFQEYSDQPERYAEVIKANLGIFFIELVRQSSQSTPEHGNLYQQERIEELLELLEKHISTHKQVSQYAEMLNLSPYQLNAISKATLGKTCSDLINEYIILESKRNLLATSNQVNQIADLMGYEDVSYFIRFFKKHTGFSPEAFRHSFR